MYQRWYYELTLDHIEQVSHLSPHLRLGWANTKGYVSYPGGGEKWGGNGVGDDLYSFGFDGSYLWTGGRYTLVNPQVLPEDGELNVKFRSLRFLGIYFLFSFILSSCSFFFWIRFLTCRNHSTFCFVFLRMFFSFSLEISFPIFLDSCFVKYIFLLTVFSFFSVALPAYVFIFLSVVYFYAL